MISDQSTCQAQQNLVRGEALEIVVCAYFNKGKKFQSVLF